MRPQIFNLGWAPRYMANVLNYCWRCWRYRAMVWVATALAVGGVLAIASNAELFLVLADRSLTNQLRSASEFQVFLSDGAKTDQVNQLQQNIARVNGVRSVQYRSKEEALNLARQDSNLNQLVGQTQANPLPASLVVDLGDPKAAPEVAIMAKQSGVADHNVPASYTPDQAQRLGAFLSLAQAVAAGVAIAGLVIASFVALVLLRSGIRARRAELRILTLVGTPRSVIRFPLFVEAVSLALVGTLISVLVLTYVGSQIVPSVNSYLPFLELGSATKIVGVISLFTLASSLLALGASSLLVRLPR